MNKTTKQNWWKTAQAAPQQPMRIPTEAEIRQREQLQAQLNVVRDQRNSAMQELKGYVAQKNNAIASGITNSGLANKIILQTDTALASDANVQKAVDKQIQLDNQFMSMLPPEDLAGSKAATQRMIQQSAAYADQIAKGQAPAQQ